MRKYVRAIAKARLEAMGIKKVNTVMAMGIKHSKHRKLMRTFIGRKKLDEMRGKFVANWRAVTTGDLAKDAFRAQMGLGKKKKYRIAS